MTSAPVSVPFSGLTMSIQPRIRLTRSFDQRFHTYLGYVLLLRGLVGSVTRDVHVAISSSTQAQYQLRAGDRISGRAVPVADPRTEIAQVYKVSQLTLLERGVPAAAPGPPWRGVSPPLSVYRERGHRRLDANTYERRCTTCVWGCRMPVEMIVDQWKPEIRQYRSETFCYGPLSCSFYRPGAKRTAPGRKGMSYVEEDWVDDEEVGHRARDE